MSAMRTACPPVQFSPSAVIFASRLVSLDRMAKVFHRWGSRAAAVVVMRIFPMPLANV